MLTVTFEDHGQDFLEFDIEDHKVVGCRPFQAEVWVGLPITNDDIKPGDRLCVGTVPRPPRGLQNAMIRYPVIHVKQQEAKHHA